MPGSVANLESTPVAIANRTSIFPVSSTQIRSTSITQISVATLLESAPASKLSPSLPILHPAIFNLKKRRSKFIVASNRIRLLIRGPYNRLKTVSEKFVCIHRSSRVSQRRRGKPMGHVDRRPGLRRRLRKQNLQVARGCCKSFHSIRNQERLRPAKFGPANKMFCSRIHLLKLMRKKNDKQTQLDTCVRH